MSKVVRFPEPKQPDPETLLTADELADRWGVCRDTVYRIAPEELPVIKIGSRSRYRLADVLAYEERHMDRGR